MTALTQCVIAWLIAFAVRCVGLAFGWHKEARYMNLPTILILALIGIALFAALRSMKKHPSGCSGHCSGCPVQCKSEKHR